MISVIVATQNSERALVPTLSALIPGAMSGLVSEVVVADGGSTDATAEVADIAGCRLIASEGTLGSRLNDAARSTRTPWLMFLRAGALPEAGWMAAVESFIQSASYQGEPSRAAVFRPGGASDLMRPRLSELLTMLRVMIGGGAKADQGLLIARTLYDTLGGHPDGADTEAVMLRKLGRRRVAMLTAGMRYARAI